MQWLIVGAGALGSILGAHLSQAGEDVTLLARGARAELLRNAGIRLTGLQDFTASVRIAEDPRELATADVLVLTVKTYDTLSALVSFNRDAGDVTAALTYAEQLAKIEPNNAELKTLIETLRTQGQGKQQ